MQRQKTMLGGNEQQNRGLRKRTSVQKNPLKWGKYRSIRLSDKHHHPIVGNGGKGERKTKEIDRCEKSCTTADPGSRELWCGKKGGCGEVEEEGVTGERPRKASPTR